MTSSKPNSNGKQPPKSASQPSPAKAPPPRQAKKGASSIPSPASSTGQGGKDPAAKPAATEATPHPGRSRTRSSKASAGPIPEEKQRSLTDLALLIWSRLQRFASDAAGVLVLAFGLMTLLALVPGLSWLTGGRLLAPWAYFLRQWLGWGSLFVVALLGIGGYLLLRRSQGTPLQVKWMRVFALEGAAFMAMMLIALAGGASLDRAEMGMDGGRIGWGLVEFLRLLLGVAGLNAIFWRYLIVDIAFLLFAVYGLGLTAPLKAWSRRWAGGASSAGDLVPEPAVSLSPIETEDAASTVQVGNRKKKVQLPAEFRKQFRVQAEKEQSAPPPPRDERLPPLDLLVNEASSRPDERNINLTAGLIEKTLSEFGIPAKVIGFRIGPTVTQFAVEPGFLEKPAKDPDSEANRMKVRVAQIASLQRDLALALSADRLRIEAPVPGRPYVGIEVPNPRSSLVRLRPILETENFYRISSQLAIAMGRDVSGQPVVADLATMPHLLIAGTTGSGKSVCIAALTACLVMNNTPEDLRIIMIDPKMVELVRFNGLPHLLGKVETDLERILGVLHWTVAEMDRRYKLLEEMHARHLESYNRKIHRHKGGEPLPRIVLMIDELADLMMSAPDQTEPALVRLAQLARAVGIHLVVATQRPSTDVVTGLIKANFPARVSFAVASSVDSRVILDTVGAETLLGHGDMLFMPPDAPAPVRTQGVYVTDQEVERVITFWQNAHQAQGGEQAPWEQMLAEEEVLADKDDLVKKAIEIVRDSRKASASMLQRRLRIGYPRAARLIDELEELGVVGPATAGREREVLIEPGDADPRENVEFDDEEGT